MNTRVFRIDLSKVSDIQATLVSTCDAQLAEGFKLASTFLLPSYNLVLIFQKV